MGVFRFEVNGWRGRVGVMISTASMIILGLTGVVGLGGTGCGAGSSSSSGPSSSMTTGAFFFVRDRVVLVVCFEGPALALVVRVVVRIDALEGGLMGGGLVDGGFDGGSDPAVCSSTSTGRALGGLLRRLGAIVFSISIETSASATTAAAFLVARFGGAFSVLDGPAAALDRVVLAPGFFFAGSGSSRTSDSCSAFATRLVVRAAVRGLGGGLAGVTGPSDRSLRRDGSDGRGSAGAFRFGGIVGRVIMLRGFGRWTRESRPGVVGNNELDASRSCETVLLIFSHTPWASPGTPSLHHHKACFYSD